MTSVDEIFQGRNVSKRKFEDPTTSFQQQSNKSAKLINDSSPCGSNGQKSPSLTNGTGSKAAFVQDEVLDEEDIQAGPAPPPDSEDENENDEDEEGRFFGGGVTKQEKEILDLIDENETGEVEEKIDTAWLRRTAINFERKINKNAELRAKYENDPMKFVSSEADLDTEIKNLSLLSEHGDLYRDFVKTGSAGSLVGLLAHENTDIAISVCQLLAELTDEDTGADEEQWKLLVDALVASDLIDLLVSNLNRLDEENNETDRAGVYYVLNVVENLLSEPQNLEVIGSKDALMEWLISRIRKSDINEQSKVGQNRQYSAEILAIILQESPENRTRFAQKDGVDILLQMLSSYRKKDPEKDSGEEEFVENLFDCLTCTVEDRIGSEKFLESEGMELCLIMLREGKLSKSRALKVLDHAMNGGNAVAASQRLVEAAGLKTIFSMFMKSTKLDRSTIEHLIGILSSMLRHLPADSEERIRLLAKFMEKDYEKIERLIELRKEYQNRLDKVDVEINKEKSQYPPDHPDIIEKSEEWYNRRLEEGSLFPLQTIDQILTWLLAEDDGARKFISSLFPKPDGLEILKKSLKDQSKEMVISDMKDILETLISCI